MGSGRCIRVFSRLCATVLCAAVLVALPGCGGDAQEAPATGVSNPAPSAATEASDSASSEPAPGKPASSEPAAAGASFTPVEDVEVPDVSDLAPTAIDASTVDEGYVSVSAESPARLKFQVTNGEMTYNYDLPNDGTPTMYPINMEDGAYLFRIMQNTSGSNYVELDSTTADVALDSPFAPYLLPNMYCEYDGTSACIAKAQELVEGAASQADALSAICSFVVENISYDNAKAERLATTAGYAPDPDDTLATKSGICSDYSSLAAAMLRSQGIPTKIVTGYVDPNDIYHAWIMVYIDGTWKTTQFDVASKTWSRVDTTFASTGGSAFVGSGVGYTDRYVY